MHDESISRNLNTFSENNYITEENIFQKWQAPKFKKLVDLIYCISPRCTIADVGCFTGIGTQLFLNLEGVDEVHGFDASENALSMAEKRGIKTHRWLAGVEESPVDDSFFDVTVAADIIEHLINTGHFVKELVRITKPGGVIVISTPNLAYWHSRIRLLFGKPPWSYPGVSSDFRKDIGIDLNHIRINAPGEWAGFFESNGLRLLKRYGYRIEGVMSGFRKVIDLLMTRLPDYSFGNIYVLQNCK